MTGCSRCGSAAINPFSHGRDPAKDLHLCDVCYWRERAKPISESYRLQSQLDDAERGLRVAEATIANLKRENKRLEDELLGPQP